MARRRLGDLGKPRTEPPNEPTAERASPPPEAEAPASKAPEASTAPTAEERRAQARELHAKLVATSSEEYWGLIVEAYEAKLESTWCAEFPRKRKYSKERAAKDLDEDTLTALREEAEAAQAEATTAHRTRVAAARGAVLASFEHVEPEAGELRRWKSRSVHTFSSQGMGAEGYAKARAEIDAESVEAAGFQSSIEVEGTTYHVLAGVAPGEFEDALLDHVALPTVREFVRMCWARARQPRVYLPGLPPDYETAAELDYQGNDLRAVVVS